MHELALADAVLATARNVAEDSGLSVIHRVDVRIGELQSISTRVMETAIRDLIPPDEPRFASTTVTFRIEPARLTCRPCGREFALADVGGHGKDTAREAIHFVPELAHAFLACPGCASADFDVASGRGVYIAAIEGE